MHVSTPAPDELVISKISLAPHPPNGEPSRWHNVTRLNHLVVDPSRLLEPVQVMAPAQCQSSLSVLVFLLSF